MQQQISEQRAPLLVLCWLPWPNSVVVINVDRSISKFEDDRKIGVVVESEEGHQRIKLNIDQLEKWVEKWHKTFTLDE